LKIIPGPSSLVLGKKIAFELGVESHPVEHRIFPDGESYIKITVNLEKEETIIVQTTIPNQDTSLMQLFFMVETAKDLGAKKIICVIPYLAYTRQDKRFLKGESLSLNTIIKILENLEVNELVVIDVHNEESLGNLQKKHRLKMKNLSAISILADHLSKIGYNDAYSLSPDIGSMNLAKAASNILKGGYGYFEKIRDRKTGEIEMFVKDTEIHFKNAVIFDDIISSGGTMLKAISKLKDQGTRRIAVACTHGLFIKDAADKIIKAGAEIILSTDSVQSKYSNVSVSKLLADYIIGRHSSSF
jgi:ribose-phosphate pyrophosphokinase